MQSPAEVQWLEYINEAALILDFFWFNSEQMTDWFKT